MTVTARLKQELWKRFGSRETPAEWDGNVLGGGKLSQRFWEYFEAIRMLDLSENSVVLDVGGGSPETGAGFFAALLATQISKVIILDPNVAEGAASTSRIEFVRENASYDTLNKIFMQRKEITHVACVSVFEHIEPQLRESMVQAIDKTFRGVAFVATFEFHARTTYFEHQLTAKTCSQLFSPLSKFYLDDFQSSPVMGETAYDTSRLLRVSRRNQLIRPNIPLWYPVAVRFLRHSVEEEAIT